MKNSLFKSLCFKASLLVSLFCFLGAGNVWAQTVSWERVTSLQTLFDGGTFIMGYENSAKTGTIVPLRSKDCGATTSANGYFYTGTTDGSSTDGTITMSNLTNVMTSDYEVYIKGVKVNNVNTYINIQRANSSGNYYGASSGGSSKNTARLYTSGNSNETNLIPEWSNETNNQFKLSANVTGSYKYLKYNTGSPRFAFYNSAGEKIVFYKKVVKYTLTYSATNGSISGVVYNTSTAVASGAAVAEGGKVTLTATPNDGFTFTGWSVNGTGSSVSDASANPTTFTMGKANTTVTANFQAAAGDYISANPTTANIEAAGDVAEFSLSTSISTPSYSVAYYTTSAGNVSTTKPSWFGDVEFSGNTLDIEVNANTGVARSAYFRVYSGETYSPVITVNQAALTVQAPSFNPESGTAFIGSNIVQLSCETAGSTIYYTMGNNPADPTESSTEYDPKEGIEVTANTTIKAIAYVGDVASAVSTASYTVVQPLTTMDEIFTASAIAGTYYVTMNNWVVSGVGGKSAYITDGEKGFIAYNNNHGFAVGNILSGTVQASLTRYKGSAEFTTITTSTQGLTVSTGGTVTPQVVAISDLSGVNTGALVRVNNVTYDSTDQVLKDASNNEIKPYTTLYSGSYSNGNKYNVTGVYQQFDETKEILPRSSADIVEVTDPTLSIDPSTAESFTYVYGNGPSEDQMFTVTGTNLASSDITATVTGQYEITDDSVYGNSVTVASEDIISIRLKADLAKGEYNGTLTLSSEGAENVVVNLSGSVTGQTYAISQKTVPADAHGTITFSPESPIEDGTEVTLAAEPADGYDFTANSWVFYKQSGEEWIADNSISVSNNKFTMPAYALKVDATFVAKTTYAISTVVTPDNSGTVATEENAWEGKTVSVEVKAEDGYAFSSIVVAKTGDSNTTVSTSGNATDGFTFTMPAYAVTVTATFNEVVDYATLPFEWEGGGKTDFTKLAGVTVNSLGDDYGSTHNPYNIKFDGTGDYIQIKTDSQPDVVTIGVKMIGGATSSKITVKASSDGNTFDNGEELTISGSQNDELTLATTRSFGSSVRYVQLYFTKGSNVGVGPITISKLSTDPSITLDKNSVDAVATGDSGTITVTCKNMVADPDLEVLFYESNGTTSATYDWLTASINDDGNVAYTINANSGEERSAYFKVHEKTNNVFSGLVTITQDEYVIDYASLPFSWDDASTPTGVMNNGVGTYSSSPYLKFDGTGDYIILKINETPGILSFVIKGNGFSNGTFKVQTSVDGADYSDLGTYTDFGDKGNDQRSCTFNNLANDIRYIKWIYTEKSSGNVALGKINLNNTIPATAATVLSESKYVTSFYSGTKNYQLSEGALAYTVGLVSDKLVFYRIGEDSNVIPKGNAVVIISSVESIKYTEISDSNVPAGATVHAGNILKGKDTEYTPDGTVYVLGIENNILGFYKLKAGTTIPAGKAYYEPAE